MLEYKLKEGLVIGQTRLKLSPKADEEVRAIFGHRVLKIACLAIYTHGGKTRIRVHKGFPLVVIGSDIISSELLCFMNGDPIVEPISV